MFTLIPLFFFGTTIGSFLTVLIDRLPRDESVTQGRSYCESCKKTLRWLDLIPIFSFVFLQGKCRYCRVPLSFYYPLVELVTGILFVATALFLQDRFMIYDLRLTNVVISIYYLFIISSLIVVFFTDLKYGIIPDKIVYTSIAISLLYFFFIHKSLILNHVLSALGAFLFFLFITLVTREKGMGYGDVKLVFLLGLVLGSPATVIALYLAFLTGGVVALILVLWGKKRVKNTIPFGPFLVFSAVITLFFQDFLFRFARAVLHL